MSVWDQAFTVEQFVVDFMLVSALLVAGTVGRRYVGLFQRFLVPNSLIAGALGLVLGPELLHLVDFSLDRMGMYVYHLLALTFIGVGLQRPSGRSRGAVGFGFIQILSFLIQVLIGLGIGLGIVYLIDPTFIPAVGTLLPLGLGMGPGIAFSIGQSWEAYGFAGGGSVGLTIAALGFLVAYSSGILIVNRGIRQGRAAHVTEADGRDADVRTGLVKRGEPAVGARLTLSPSAIEPLTFHVGLIGGVYLLTYVLLQGAAAGLVAAGLEREVPTLWSFHFVFANVLALGTRRLLDARGLAYLVDDGLMSRSTGFFADVLIATSVMGISLSVAEAYLVPLLVMCGVGSFVTYLAVRWAAERAFADYHFERFAGIYGQMTGTISSGLALIRVADPDYRTPVAQDLVLGSGIAFVLGFPLLLLINLPFTVYQGALEGYWVVFGAAAAYLAFILVVWTRFGLQRKPTAVL